MHDRLVKVLSAAHAAVFRGSGGRLGRRLVDNDMGLLTTTGRNSGLAHTVPLLVLTDDASWVVIASYGGRPRHPDWYLNLVEEPRAILHLGTERIEVKASTLRGEDRARWWRRAVEAYEGYAVYDRRSSRQIPVVRLARHPRTVT